MGREAPPIPAAWQWRGGGEKAQGEVGGRAGRLKNCPSIGQFGRSRAEGSAAGGVKSANLLRGRGAGRDPPLKNSQDGSIYGHVLSLRLSWSGGSRLDSSYDGVGGFAPPIG